MLSEMMCRRSCQQQQQQQQQDGKGAPQRDPSSRRKHGWSKSCRGRQQGRRGGGWPWGRNHPQQPPQRHHPPRRFPRPVVSLRPVNVKGNRARGMRAPKNTNQFLMHEKYQMLHMRSDSVGSDSSSSESDVELTDMDSYLGVLENARGALLDSPNPHGSPPPPPGQIVVLHEDSLRLHEDSLRLQEDSMQYFPSEDDLIKSQNFMQRDFVEFCDILTP
ncbi:uncharacterized protein LOC142954733 [Anarhichas minor]|uniref:uncharacterized protein LOC142954733 n=1 Tax=Anarhichas minor TaxID=65739 RepID=UPI003F73A1C3